MESKFTNKYDNAYSILEKLEQGGSGGSGGKVVLVDGTKFGNSTFTEVPENLDFSEVNDFKQMFCLCKNLTTAPQLDTTNCSDFGSMFYGCTNLRNIPPLDTSNGTNFYGMFNDCSLASIPQIDTSNGTDFSYMFAYSRNRGNIPPLDTSKGTKFEYMFYTCNNLTTIPQLNLTNSTKFSSMFYLCYKLENIKLEGSINANISFSSSSSLTYDSIKSILTAASNATNTSSKTLSFNRTIADQNGELSALVGSSTTKGWTITGLTLE